MNKNKIDIKGIDEKNLNPHNYGGMCSRQAILKAENIKEAKDFEKGIDTIATTEQPAIVVDWERWEFVREVLPMKYAELPDNDKTVLLDAHSRVSIEKVKGSAKNWRTENENLIAKLFISSTEEKLKTNIKEQHIDSVSIGYETSKENTVEVPKGAEVTVDGVIYKNEYEDGIPFLVRTWWKTKELSLVPIGADDKAKLKAEVIKEIGIKSDDPELQKKLNDILQSHKNLESQINQITIKGGKALENNEEKKKPDELTDEQKRELENKKIDKFASGRFDGKYKDFAEKAKSSGLTYDQFAAMVFDKIEEKGSAVETPGSFLDLTKKQLKDFRITRAAQAVIEGKQSKLPESENASFEFECSKEIEKKLGKAPTKGSLFLPYDIRNREVRNMMGKAHSTTAGEGGEFVPTDLRTDLMPEYLRNAVIMGRLGATILTGLSGNLEIPKIVSSLSAEAVAEDTAASASYITTGSVEASPHTVSANTVYGRQWFYQSDLSVDTMLMSELEAVKNVKVDSLSLNGTGGTEPTGYLQLSGLSDIEMTAPTWRKILSFAKTLKKANAFTGNRYAWLMSPDVEQEVKAAEKFATTGQTFLMNNQMDGIGYEWSNQVGDQILSLANWAEAYIMFWGAEELLIDPYYYSTSGQVRLTIFTMFDFIFRQTAAAVVADDYALSA